MVEGTLSVIMPNYNHGRYIGEALEAILNQSFRPLEVIVVDDGSTDNSLAVIEQFAKRDPIVRVLRNDRNEGFFFTVKRGLSHASGEYVYFPGADDRVLPGFFEKCVDFLTRHPRAGFSTALIGFMEEDGEDLGVLPSPFILGAPCFVPPEEALALLRQHGLWVYRWAAPIYRRSAFVEVGGHIPELGSFSDAFLDQVIALKHGACLIPERLVMWRKTESGYSWRTVANLGIWAGIIRHAAGLMLTTYADLFPPDWVDDWESEYLYREGLDRITAAQRGQLATLSQLLPPHGLMDRAFFSGLRLSLGAERLLMRLYLYLRLRRRYLLPVVRNIAKRSLMLGGPRWPTRRFL